MPLHYFSYESDPMLKCPCCGERGMNERFMMMLDELRAGVGFAFNITSGFRCPDYNSKLSSTGRTGPHTYGRAVDISATSRQKYLIMAAARDFGWSRFGIGKNFIHVDSLNEADGFTPEVIWTY